MTIRLSTSEEHGLGWMTDSDLEVYSVGISSGCNAEMIMARTNPKRKIIATTVDEKGIIEAQDFIKQLGLEKQIEAKIEDVADTLPYKDEHFDYIYARLVLHYLPKQKLGTALKELFRILKAEGKIFIVVRSSECDDARRPGSAYDEDTGLTTYKIASEPSKGKPATRYFHTQDSMREFLDEAGFKIDHIEQYDERLFKDFMRKEASNNSDNLIEVRAVK